MPYVCHVSGCLSSLAWAPHVQGWASSFTTHAAHLTLETVMYNLCGCGSFDASGLLALGDEKGRAWTRRYLRQ